jgi:hypothetical protein
MGASKMQSGTEHTVKKKTHLLFGLAPLYAKALADFTITLLKSININKNGKYYI